MLSNGMYHYLYLHPTRFPELQAAEAGKSSLGCAIGNSNFSCPKLSSWCPLIPNSYLLCVPDPSVKSRTIHSLAEAKILETPLMLHTSPIHNTIKFSLITLLNVFQPNHRQPSTTPFAQTAIIACLDYCRSLPGNLSSTLLPQVYFPHSSQSNTSKI